MKTFILYFILITYSVCGYSQFNKKLVTNSVAATDEKRWDLDKYVWSHTNYKNGKHDKPVIDFDAIDNWVSLAPDEHVSVSSDGKYIAYGIQAHNHRYRTFDTLVIQSLKNQRRLAFEFKHNTFKRGFFSSDNKQYIYQDGDSLHVIETISLKQQYAKGVASYKLLDNNSNEWFAYQLRDIDKTVILHHLTTGKEVTFKYVSSYFFDKSSQWFSVQLNNTNKELVIYNLANESLQSFPFVKSYLFSENGNALLINGNNGLQHISFPAEKSLYIWSRKDSSCILGKYSFDGGGKQVVFAVDHRTSLNFSSAKKGSGMEQTDSDYVIYYWKEGMNEAVIKVTNQTAGLTEGMFLQGEPSFTDNGRYLQFYIESKQKILPPPLPDAVPLDIWDYRDTILQSIQLNRLKAPAKQTCKVIFNLETGKLLLLEDFLKKLVALNGDFAVLRQTAKALHGDRFWETDYYKDSCWLVSLQDGSRQFLVRGQFGGTKYFWFSPGCRYLLYFDADKGCNYYSYNLLTGKRQAISFGAPEWQLGNKVYYLPSDETPTAPVGIACWLENDNGLLVYDEYDIWQLDLTGKKSALNLTNGYGRMHKTIFRLMKYDESKEDKPDNFVCLSNGGLVLSAFNIQNKFNGFYLKTINKKGNPEMLSFGPYFMVMKNDIVVHDHGMIPLKAAKRDIWIVRRQTPIEAPNYFVTRDFKDYSPLTNLQPQKKYNWLTSELHSFKQLSGTVSQGVLYKPENFDSSKKYPVIVSFYVHLSDNLYQFPSMDYIYSPIIDESPAWMVSHGYLVFLPDIHFMAGKYGPSTVNGMDGAANYLKKLPYVDSSHIAAVGHSNSGRFGYYLLTHSNSFAAMSLSSGFGGTDIISIALSLTGDGSNALEWAEDLRFGAVGSGGLGNLWKNKANWIDHSAVLQADNATCPLLLMHNKNDVADDVRLAAELYISLRRLQKKAWWLQYDRGAHRVLGLLDARDFTIRYTQFFDHYLKGVPAPRWMTQGLPAKYKTIESRFELDFQGSCGNDCKVCSKVR